jgi:hypothetical protein
MDDIEKNNTITFSSSVSCINTFDSTSWIQHNLTILANSDITMYCNINPGTLFSIYEHSNFTVYSIAFMNASTSNFEFIYCEDSNLTLINCLFRDNFRVNIIEIYKVCPEPVICEECPTIIPCEECVECDTCEECVECEICEECIECIACEVCPEPVMCEECLECIPCEECLEPIPCEEYVECKVCEECPTITPESKSCEICEVCSEPVQAKSSSNDNNYLNLFLITFIILIISVVVLFIYVVCMYKKIKHKKQH